MKKWSKILLLILFGIINIIAILIIAHYFEFIWAICAAILVAVLFVIDLPGMRKNKKYLKRMDKNKQQYNKNNKTNKSVPRSKKGRLNEKDRYN